MRKNIYILLALFTLCFFQNSAQNLWNNNGATTISTSNSYIIINGGLINQTNGTIDNSGTIRLTGDWTNNATNTALINSSPGKVLLNGPTQQIIGTNQTVFNRLELAGTGVKQLRDDIDCTVEDSLILNDREFDLDTNTVFVTNTSPGIITRTTGFCSSLTDGGLARNTNSVSTYLYPVGSSLGTARYRPIAVTPNSATANTYKVRMANVDATIEGYNVATKDSALCMVNNLFYHRIYRLNGTSAADLTFYFDSLTDGYYNTSAHWQTVPQWEDMLSTTNLYNVSPSFSTVTKTGWNSFTPYYPYALAISTPSVNLFTVPTTPTVCQNDTIAFHATTGFTNYDFYVNGTVAQSGTDSLFSTNNLSTNDIVTVISTDGRSCDAYSNAIANIIINPLPVVTATTLPNDTLCTGDMLTLSGSGALTYAWDNGVTDATAFATTATTTYTVIGTDVNGCRDTLQTTITVNPLPIVVANTMPGNTLCAGDVLTLSGSGALNYVWDNSAIDGIAFSPTATATYSVIGTDTNGCVNTDQVLITVNSLPIVQINAVNDSVCSGGSTQVTASGNATTYTWNDGSNATSFNFTPLNDSILFLNGVDANGCINSDSLLISVLPIPAISPLSDVNVCSNESIQLNVTGTGINNVVWSNGNTLDDSTSTSPLASPISTTTYIVTAFTGTCTDSDTLLVTVNSLPALNAGNDTTINFGQSVDINAATTGTSYSWTPSEGLSCNDCVNPTASPQVTTEYYLTVTDTLGCTKTDTLTIYVELDCIDLFVPNIFTPNGDMDNDVIYVYNGLCIETMTFMIYDRWGNKVFETSDPFQGWDGNYKGGVLESGVYVYVVSAVLTSGTEVLKKGNITLLK